MWWFAYIRAVRMVMDMLGMVFLETSSRLASILSGRRAFGPLGNGNVTMDRGFFRLMLEMRGRWCANLSIRRPIKMPVCCNSAQTGYETPERTTFRIGSALALCAPL